MTHDELCKLALEEAEKSPCKKRKVGAIIVNYKLEVVSTGHNHVPIYASPYQNCEDNEGNTIAVVRHAEVSAIHDWLHNDTEKLGYPFKIYVTHQPCKNCQAEIDSMGLEVVLVDQFMKFDTGKLRYGLIPPEATKALASVLTYGAKKYKPNNWKQAEDTERYVDALYRHLEAWRGGEEFDDESKLSHLSHALTNIAFLIYFEERGVDNRSGQNID